MRAPSRPMRKLPGRSQVSLKPRPKISIFRKFVLLCGLFLLASSASAQIFDTEIEGLTAEQWADKIIKDGQDVFNAEYEPLDETYSEYKLLTRIFWGNPDPETQKELIEDYRAAASKSGDRRHMNNIQMIDDILSGTTDMTYYTENGDWFTAMLANWFTANFVSRNDKRFFDLVDYYDPIVEANADDLAYPVAMYIYTDWKRFTEIREGDLPGFTRNFKENYYWMKRLYPEYNVRFLYVFDTIGIHDNLFGHPSSLKLLDQIDDIDTRSFTPANHLIMSSRRARIILAHDDHELAYAITTEELASPEFSGLDGTPGCLHHCERLRSLAALSAAATGRTKEAQEILENMTPVNMQDEHDIYAYHSAALAILNIESPTKENIQDWINGSYNTLTRQQYLVRREFTDPKKGFTPPESEPRSLIPAFLIGGLLLSGLGLWAFLTVRSKSRQLSNLGAENDDVTKRATVLEQYLNDIHAVTELSGNHTRNSLLSLERNIDNPRTLEIVDIVSKTTAQWASELSNLVFSAKYMALGNFDQTERIEFDEYETATKSRWETMARLEKSSLSIQTHNVPVSFYANRLFIDVVLDLFVQEALDRSSNDIVTVSFASTPQQDFLSADISDNGTRPTDYSQESMTNGNVGSASRVLRALKALDDIGGHYEQIIGDEGQTHNVTLHIPIKDAENFKKAANSN